jgi:serine/threonine protein kinase
LSIDELPAQTGENVLYALSDDVDEARAQLEQAFAFDADAQAGRAALLAAVEALLRDPGVQDEVTLRVARVRAVEDRPCVRGPLGLYLGLNAATALAACEGPNDALLGMARAWLKEDEVVDCLYDFYGVDPDYLDLTVEDAGLHRVGTTSMIFRCPQRSGRPSREDPLFALKCLLPRYFGVQAIKDRTRDYRRSHPFTRLRAFSDVVPEVRHSSEKTIVMDFVEGTTLAELLDERAKEDVDELALVEEEKRPDALARRRALKQDDIAFIRKLLIALCGVLGRLHDDQRSHLDLSPANVIVRGEDDDELQLTLIDFGHNFAVSERVGSSAAIRRAGLYVAPELLEDPARFRETSREGWRCDAYSLGVILLELAARRRIAKDELTRELERLWQGDGEWNGALGLARVVEELIDERPEHRLLLMDEATGTPANPYAYLDRLVRQETEVQALYEEHSAGVGFGLLKGYTLLKLHGNVQLRNLLEVGRAVRRPVDDSYRDYPALARWTRVALYSWFFVVTAFVLLTMADLHVYVLGSTADALHRALDPPFEVGAFWDNLPGRAVALTFALTQVTYYVNNYAVISPKRVDSKLGRASELVLRADTILLSIPVLWAMLWQPSAWPLCSGIGTLLVVVNNYLTLRIARRAATVGRARGFSTLGEAGKKFVDDMYSEWWTLMGFYSLSLIAIGILLDAGVAHDAGLFAALVVLINLAKMYRLNCVRFAPQVRGCLSHAILTLRRSDRLGEAPDGAEARKPALPSGLRTVALAWRLDAAERT